MALWLKTQPPAHQPRRQKEPRRLRGRRGQEGYEGCAQGLKLRAHVSPAKHIPTEGERYWSFGQFAVVAVVAQALGADRAVR
jgi:hypothetical protein